MIIAISGKMGSGKTTLASLLAPQLALMGKGPIVPLKFAGPIYEAVQAIEGVLGLNSTTKDRKLLQLIGAHYREKMGPHFWAEQVKTRISALDPKAVVVIDDLRYPEELDVLKSLGAFLIRLEAPENVRRLRVPESVFTNLNHPSETALDDAHSQFQLVLRADLMEPGAICKVVLNNLTIEETVKNER